MSPGYVSEEITFLVGRGRSGPLCGHSTTLSLQAEQMNPEAGNKRSLYYPGRCTSHQPRCVRKERADKTELILHLHHCFNPCSTRQLTWCICANATSLY